MSHKIYICDFNDSFTYNIFSTLKEINPTTHIEVVPFKRLLNFFQVMEYEDSKNVIILGPGPGHPQDYKFLYHSLEKILLKNNFFFMGICLGHQIIWDLNGLSTEHCNEPIHGHVVSYNLPKQLSNKLGLETNISVQRYNSLAVKITESEEKQLLGNRWELFIVDSELIISSGKNIISYQFHPESIGTSCPKAFFSPVFQFLL